MTNLVNGLCDSKCRRAHTVIDRFVRNSYGMLAMLPERAIDLLRWGDKGVGVTTFDDIDCFVREAVRTIDDRSKTDLDGLRHRICA